MSELKFIILDSELGIDCGLQGYQKNSQEQSGPLWYCLNIGSLYLSEHDSLEMCGKSKPVTFLLALMVTFPIASVTLSLPSVPCWTTDAALKASQLHRG